MEQWCAGEQGDNSARMRSDQLTKLATEFIATIVADSTIVTQEAPLFRGTCHVTSTKPALPCCTLWPEPNYSVQLA